MHVKATVLVENSVHITLGLTAEHGWSVYLETDVGNYLLDAGQGMSIVNNSLILGKDITNLKGLIISHHHIDHTGGLLNVLNLSGPIDVYTHKDFEKESYYTLNKKLINISVPFKKEVLESKGAKFIYTNGWTEIAEGFYLTGEIPRKVDYETGDKNLLKKCCGSYLGDKVEDDQAVVFKNEKGLFIVLGCAHAGLINTLNYIIEKTGEERIETLIGGTHLWPVSDRQRIESINELKRFNIKTLGVSHCTGMQATIELAKEYKEKFFLCNVGRVVEV